jgi:hypothetical protein
VPGAGFESLALSDHRPGGELHRGNWLARHNKTIFGVLFVVGGLFALAQWLLFGR